MGMESNKRLIYVLDVVDAIIKSAETDDNLFLNIGTDVETSVNELVSILSKKFHGMESQNMRLREKVNYLEVY